MLSKTIKGPAAPGLFPPEVRAAAVHLACQQPNTKVLLKQPPADLDRAKGILGSCIGQDEQGLWWICVPVSRLCSAIIALALAGLGVVTSLSKRTVARWLSSAKIKPWHFRSWITPKCIVTFLERARPILDLYASIKALGHRGEVVWSVDEKTSIQARSHDSYKASARGEPAHIESTYARGGAVQLFAALNVLTGYVAAQVVSLKNFATFQEFLNSLVAQSIQLGHKVIHLILDNATIHRPKSLEELVGSAFPDVTIVIHWLPVRSSWLNQIETYFSKVQTHVLTPNNYDCINHLTRTILAYIDLWNLAPRPIQWTYTAAELYRKYDRQLDPGIWSTRGNSIW